MLFLVLVADFFVLVLVFVNGIVIFSFLVIFVFVNENHTAYESSVHTRCIPILKTGHTRTRQSKSSVNSRTAFLVVGLKKNFAGMGHKVSKLITDHRH